jgi:RNA-directed DNA polymerase
MHRYLRAWRERSKGQQYRARIVAYADDFVILSRGRAAEALEWTRWAMGRLGLTLNETKTGIRNARAESFDFLGYTFGPDRFRKDGRWYLSAKPSRKSIQRVKRAVRGVLRPGNQGTWAEVRTRLNRIVGGWANYFSYGTRALAYQAVNHYVHDSVRHFLRRRRKVLSRGARRFSAQQVFGELGVLRLRTLRVGPPA